VWFGMGYIISRIRVVGHRILGFRIRRIFPGSSWSWRLRESIECMFINNHKMLCKFIKRFVSKNMEYGFATTDKPILVTGASGFIASNLVRKLL
jgi:hypothetical protein